MRSAVTALFAAALGSAAMVAPSIAMAAPPVKGRPVANGPDASKAATALFTRGTELFKAKKFGPAMEQFRQSYALVPSPNSHLYVARCMAALGDTRNAYVEFNKVVDEATQRAVTEEKYAPTRDSARVERDELSSKLGLVTVTLASPDLGRARIGRYDLAPEDLGRPYPLDPGNYDVVVEGLGRPPIKQSISVGPGEKREVLLSAPVGPVAGPVEPPPPVRSSKINGLIIGGIIGEVVGVAGFAMFAAEGAASKSTYSSLEKTCGSNGGCGTHDVSSDISKGKSQQTIANVGLGLGIAGVATGTTLIVLGVRKKSSAPQTGLVVGPGYVGYDGTF